MQLALNQLAAHLHLCGIGILATHHLQQKPQCRVGGAVDIHRQQQNPAHKLTARFGALCPIQINTLAQGFLIHGA